LNGWEDVVDEEVISANYYTNYYFTDKIITACIRYKLFYKSMTKTLENGKF